MSTYRPGDCNIGREQRRRRLLVAAGAFALALATAIGYLAGVVPAPLLTLEFVFLAVGFEWALQAYTAFCVRLALRNEYDFRGEGGSEGTVSDPGARRTDRLAAVRLTAVALVLSAVTTGLLVFVLV